MKFSAAGEILPYSDRKYQRPEAMTLELEAIVQIQQMACAGKSRDEIYHAMAPRGVSAAQISRALDPPDENGSRRRMPVANLGHAQRKARFR